MATQSWALLLLRLRLRRAARLCLRRAAFLRLRQRRSARQVVASTANTIDAFLIPLNSPGNSNLPLPSVTCYDSAVLCRL